MIIKALDSQGDWVFGNGLGNYRTEKAALAQDIETKLKEWKGDCYFASNNGIDWNNRLGKPNNIAPLRLEIKVLISAIDGVTGVIDVDIVFNTTERQLILNYSINTIYSKDPINNTIQI